MGDYNRKFNIATYSGSTVYERYDVVKRASGNGEYYFVAARDNNQNQLDTVNLLSNSYWKRFDDFNGFDFATVWTPSYTTSATVQPRVLEGTLDDGVTQMARDGINTVPLRFQMTFENITDREAKSLMLFFNAMGTTRTFQWTVPEPYSKLLKFTLVSLNHQYLSKNVNNVTVQVEQSFVIFGVGAGQTKYGAF